MSTIQPIGAGDPSPFDSIRQVIWPDGVEFWSARDLMPLLGYAQWRQFADAIERAKAAATNSGATAEDHFADARKMVPLGSGAQREVVDYRLTRYGAYLAAMNSDPRKPAVAAAQTYFAVKTREAETRPALELPRTMPEALRYAADQYERAERAEARAAILGPKAEKFEAIEAGNGITLRMFHKKYFSAITERVFMEHLYAKDYLIDQRGKGPVDEETGKARNGSQHRHPTAKGKAYFYLHGGVDQNSTRRENTRVRPGDPELALCDALARDGLPANGRPQQDGLFEDGAA